MNLGECSNVLEHAGALSVDNLGHAGALEKIGPVAVMVWGNCSWQLAQVSSEGSHRGKRGAFISVLNGSHDLRQAHSIILSVVATLLLDNVELHVLLAFAGSIFAISLLEGHGEFIQSAVSLINKDAGADLAQHDLEELVMEAHKDCP